MSRFSRTVRHRAACRQALVAGVELDRSGRRRLLAVLELALDFHTWQTLANAGVSDRHAADLTAHLADHALELAAAPIVAG